MPTLSNVNGASLVPDLGQTIRQALQGYQVGEEKRRYDASTEQAAAQQADLEETLRALLQGNPGEAQAAQPGQTPGVPLAPGHPGAPSPYQPASAGRGVATGRKRDALLARIAQINPQVASAVTTILDSGDERARQQLADQAAQGVRDAAFIDSQPDYTSKLRAINTLAEKAKREGRSLDRYLELANMDELEMGNELLRMKIAGTDVAELVKPPAGPQSTIGKLRADLAAGQITQEDFDAKMKEYGPGGFQTQSARIYADGTTVYAGKSGGRVVLNPDGEVVKGKEAAEVMRKANEYETSLQGNRATSRSYGSESAKQSVSKAGEAYDTVEKIGKNLANIDKAIKAIDNGASTGAIEKYLPSFRSSSIRLENAMNLMGLDIISATTFGALSEGELQLALDTALPTGLEPAELRKWLVEKKEAQTKLKDFMSETAIKLMRGRGDVTIADILDEKIEASISIPEGEVDTFGNVFVEGKTYRNPDTGQMAVFKGGKMVPVDP